MKLPPRIEGDRVYLLPTTRKAASAILKGARPAGLNFAPGYPGEPSLEVMDLFVGLRSHEPTDFNPLFIVRREDDAIIGDIGFSFPDGPASPTVGYDVLEPLWNNGFATDALRALIAFLLTRPEIQSVRADTLKEHRASRRVMEKSGMALEREGLDDVDGVQRRLVYYEIARPD
jgi:RimJ/RimL family protein N-acetyltransferase